MSYSKNEHLGLAITFLFLFFILFYCAILSYKFINNTKFSFPDIALILINSIIFYGMGYYLCNTTKGWQDYLGLFTLANAALHLIVGSLIYKKSLADKNIFYLILGLVIAFITIAIPVQLDGNWVTLLWAIEAGVLFWIGRIKQTNVYEEASYPLMGMALLSLCQDWMSSYAELHSPKSLPSFHTLFNIHFLSTMVVLGCFGFIFYISNKTKNTNKFDLPKIIGSVCLLILFIGIGLEINHYWNVRYLESWITTTENSSSIQIRNYNIWSFNKIWLINFVLMFTGILLWANTKYLKHAALARLTILLTAIASFVFLTLGLYEISELREAYLEVESNKSFTTSSFYIIIRYISLGILTLSIVQISRIIKQKWVSLDISQYFELAVHIILIWVLSSELLHWLDFANSANQYKLALSILWGLYSMAMVSLGIWKHKQYLRIAAMVLFGITLIKLFIYDINHLDTIAKTIIFVILGVFLLIISFLYNKYKNQISNES